MGLVDLQRSTIRMNSLSVCVCVCVVRKSCRSEWQQIICVRKYVFVYLIVGKSLQIFAVRGQWVECDDAKITNNILVVFK